MIHTFVSTLMDLQTMHPLNNNNLNNKRLNKVTLQSAHSSARIGPALLGNLVSVLFVTEDMLTEVILYLITELVINGSSMMIQTM